jgi:hypothetical protein
MNHYYLGNHVKDYGTFEDHAHPGPGLKPPKKKMILVFSWNIRYILT